jgi:hypothetical protein
MKYDSYTRFLKSQLYKDCIVNEMEGRPLLSNSSKLNAKPNKFSKHNDSNNLPTTSQQTNILNSNDNVPNASSSLGAGALTPVAEAGNNVLSSSPSGGGGSNFNDAQINSNLATKSSNQNQNSTSASVNNLNTNDNNDTLNRKEKKRSTILPWTKGNS